MTQVHQYLDKGMGLVGTMKMELRIVVRISADEATHLNNLLNQDWPSLDQSGNYQGVHDPVKHSHGEQMDAYPIPFQHQIQSLLGVLVECGKLHNQESILLCTLLC